MFKIITLAAFVLALATGALLFGSSFGTWQVRADTASLVCQSVEVDLDEGYGVSRRAVQQQCRLPF